MYTYPEISDIYIHFSRREKSHKKTSHKNREKKIDTVAECWEQKNLLVNCLVVHNNILYSGSDDATIRAWNLDTNECITTLQGHTRGVRCLIVHNNILYSGSTDTTIRAWQL